MPGVIVCNGSDRVAGALGVLLAHDGWTVTIVAAPAAAWKSVQEGLADVAAVFVEYSEAGLAVCNMIRTDATTQHISVIVTDYMADRWEAMRRDCAMMDAHADTYLPEPFTAERDPLDALHHLAFLRRPMPAGAEARS